MASGLDGAYTLVTGGAGFVGSHLVDRLLQAGVAHVIVVDDLSRGRLANLGPALASGRISVVEGDIGDATLVDEVTRGVDVVFHQAALRITQCAAEPVRAVRVMVDGLQHVLEACVRHGVRKVVSASSASVYGQPDRLPMAEDHPFNNRTLYGALKIASEQMLRAYREAHDLRYVTLRPFNIYGPRMDVHGVYTEVMIRWLERLNGGLRPIILGDGGQTLDFVYVGDVADAYVNAATSDADDVAINVGSGVEVSLAELCTRMCAAAGHPDIEPEYQPARRVNPATRRQADVARAQAMLGFVATTSLDDGLRALIDWYRQERALGAGAMGCVA